MNDSGKAKLPLLNRSPLICKHISAFSALRRSITTEITVESVILFAKKSGCILRTIKIIVLYNLQAPILNLKPLIKKKEILVSMPDYHNAFMISYDNVTLKPNEHTFVVDIQKVMR